MKDVQVGYQVHYVNAADGKHLPAKVVDVHGMPDELGLLDLDVTVEFGDGKRYSVLHDEEIKAGNTWHFAETD